MVLGVGPAGEDRQHQDLRLRQLLAELFHDRLDPGGDFLGIAAADVVRADHEHGQLGLDAVDIAVVQPPQHVLRLVAADPQVDRVAFLVELLPDLFARTLPAMR